MLELLHSLHRILQAHFPQELGQLRVRSGGRLLRLIKQLRHSQHAGYFWWSRHHIARIINAEKRAYCDRPGVLLEHLTPPALGKKRIKSLFPRLATCEFLPVGLAKQHWLRVIRHFIVVSKRVMLK